MSGRSSYLATCTPRQEILICQLRYKPLFLFGPLSPVEFWALRRSLGLRFVVGASRLLLPVVPPAVESVLLSVL
jgi:hypothetical protein